MTSLSARLDTEWRPFTPLHEHTLDRARDVAAGSGGPYAGAVVGVYGSGKSTLLFTLLREAPAQGAVAVWEEAAPLIERIVAGDERLLPQTFTARVLGWVAELVRSPAALDRYSHDLAARGHADIAGAVRGQIARGARRVVLLLDELEQAHDLLRRRIAADDGQPLRALIDACGPDFRLVLAYAPESYHSVGDADRGRLAYLPVPALDVASIQASFGLSRGEANFTWWASRGRTRGVMQAVRGVIEPFRRGAFDRGLDDLGDALDALPGVFGVPAMLRDGLSHAETRALLDLVPAPDERGERGVACALADRNGLADRIKAELGRRVATKIDLQPVANELVAVLEAVGDGDDRAYLSMDDFRAAVRTAEARAIESGRQREPIERFVDQAMFVFSSLGEMGPLPRRLPIPLATLAEERFPSPFTDPYLPLESGRTPSEGELDRRFRELARTPAPLLVAADRELSVFAGEAALAAWIEAGGLDEGSEPVRAVLLAGGGPRPPIVDLAVASGRLCLREVGPFHATFLKCLALRPRAEGSEPTVEALSGDLRADRQLARKIQWHMGRIAVLLREARARQSATWTAASRFVRDERFRGALGRLKTDSPALLGLLIPLRPPTASERRLLARMARLLDTREPLRKVARMVNPGGRLSGAAVVVDELLPAGGDPPRWTERKLPGADELGELLDAFGGEPALRARLARWLFPEDPERLSALFAYHAGALPDIAEEQAQLDALQGLERTARRADAILSALESCTGRQRDSLRALRLGHVTDQVRSSGGPVAQLRALGAELRTSEAGAQAAWVRALSLWICGVFADRLLTGVEKEQAELGEWEVAAAAARELGARAIELERALGEAGADACADLVRAARRGIGNHLDARDALGRELSALRGLVTGVEPLAKLLSDMIAALGERGLSLTEAVAAYLPDEDALPSQQALLRRVPELLDEIEGPCPPPGGRGVVEYAELLRRHAEATRRERLRMRLEALLDVTVPPELRLDAEGMLAIERAWAALPPALGEALRSEIQARPLHDADELERWIDQAGQKAALVAEWPQREAPLLRAADARVVAWSRRLDVSSEQVREVDRRRSRAIAAIAGLPALLRPAVPASLISAVEPADPERIHGVLADEIQRFADELGGLMAELKAAGIGVPAEAPADTAAEVLAVFRARILDAHKERDERLSRAREIGAALERWGEKAAVIPAELNLGQARRLAEREAQRLKTRLRALRADLGAWLSAQGLPAALLPDERDDVMRSSVELEAANARRIELGPDTAALARLGAAIDQPVAADWEAVRAAIGERARRAEDELRALVRRHDEAAERARRLGGSPRAQSPIGGTLREAERLCDALEREVERLRSLRLRDCSPEARAAYTAVRSGDPTALPAAIAELVELGLIRTVEDMP
ncbi:MAG: hypothetical protein U0359_32715 [Byssovorax sp.]